jgi:hypothetical protein
MRTMKTTTGRKQRGSTLAAFVVVSAALFAFTAVGVDTGRVAAVATEVQTVADSAASAGARALLAGATTTTARTQAQSVVGQNRVNGATAVIQAAQLQTGSYNAQTGAFVSGGLPAIAMRATPSVTVRNFFAGIMGGGFANTTVTKTATAASVGVGQGQPTLPLVLGDCHFPSIASCFNTPNCLPRLTQVPNTTNNTGWTSFFDGASSAPNISKYMPAACGGTATPPNITVGASINLNNGQITSVLSKVDECVKKGINTFLIPIVACGGNFNQSSTVTGFATITVTQVLVHGSPKGLDLGAIFQAIAGPPGGGNFGTYTIRILG